MYTCMYVFYLFCHGGNLVIKVPTYRWQACTVGTLSLSAFANMPLGTEMKGKF